MPDTDPTKKLHGLDPGELLARSLDTVKTTGGASAWEPPTPEELAKLLPQYRIESLLGRGGMGAVYKGVQAALERPVAIKLLPAELASDGDFLVRFQREARTLAKLQHPGIVTVHDFGQTSAGHLYFVMEFVDGTDLQHILKGPGLQPAQAFEMIAQICDALFYAHGQGVIHRDIKPANILVTKAGRAKVADFGLARPLIEEDGSLTATNVIMGTPDYMASEQRSGIGHTDHRADIFALGVMLYEMLTGQRPHGAFQPPSHRVQVDVRIDEVVLKALQQEPDRRYQQASEMKVDVDRIRTTPPPVQSAASVRTPRWVPVAAAAALASLLGVGGWMLWQKGERPSSVKAAATSVKTATSAPSGMGTISSSFKATKDSPFVNTLGMKFVPVPGTEVLFCVWETRVQDYMAYARMNKVDDAWQTREKKGVPVSREPEYPVCGVNWDDANAFCQWLTKKETAEGKLPKGAKYRLPTDMEWSRAAGQPPEQDATPASKNGKNSVDFPWGMNWPPKHKTGNYADTAFHEQFPDAPEEWLEGYTDGYATTAPVGSFAPNEYGIYDLGGNVWEWCEDLLEPGSTDRVLRGASWQDYVRGYLLSSNRYHYLPSLRNADYGFRCVLEPAPFTALPPTTAPESSSPSTTPQPPAQ